MAIYGKVWWYIYVDNSYQWRQETVPFENDLNHIGLADIILRTKPELAPGEIAGIQNIELSRDPEHFYYTINSFVDDDPALRQHMAGRHEENGWDEFMSDNTMKMFIQRLDWQMELDEMRMRKRSL